MTSQPVRPVLATHDPLDTLSAAEQADLERIIARQRREMDKILEQSRDRDLPFGPVKERG